MTRSRLTHHLGLGPTVRPLNVVALLSSALLSISFLVFLNSIQPFYLSTVLGVPSDILGTVTGNLILADELCALVLVFVWGAVSDRVTVRWVAVLGHLFVAAGLGSYTVSRRVYPDVLGSRLVFSVGSSALVTTLGAALAGMTVIPNGLTDLSADADAPSESTTLLAASPPAANPAHSARFAGLLGFAAGMGALLAVFGYLRLPPVLAPHLDDSLKSAILVTFYIVISLAVTEGLFLIWGLRGSVTELSEVAEERAPVGWKASAVGIAKELSSGFLIASRESEIALACLSGFVFFTRSNLCDSSPDTPTCRPALILTAILTGTIQLISLLLSPAFGSVAARISPALTLAGASLLGAISFVSLAFTDNPRGRLVWLWVVGLGVSQSAGMVVSLALVARGRSRVMAEGGGKEVGGAISGVYSACGGLGILIIGKAGGSLFDKWVGAPFLLVGCMAGLVSIFAAGVHGRSRIS